MRRRPFRDVLSPHMQGAKKKQPFLVGHLCIEWNDSVLSLPVYVNNCGHAEDFVDKGGIISPEDHAESIVHSKLLMSSKSHECWR
ncbi:hypothetical protein DPMN_070808 [Dreissena polymorpha]|uniref:Uncharacterized protein n=1 Tax=Dreissena polymorpha TaxID=45954 RepID=A0A9D4BX96_DREPO|nr:hypothetical protein DPMN_070808 [Dreissena polymorpha]